MPPCRQRARRRPRRQGRRSSTCVRARSHHDDSPRQVAINWKAMSSYRDFLQETRQQIDEIDAERAHELHDVADPAIFLDVREREEWDEGYIPGAVHIPRGWLESRIEQAVPDRSRPVVAYYPAGNRSTFPAKTPDELGYPDVVNLPRRINDWKGRGYPLAVPSPGLEPQQRTPYS